jgi:hypothetical protein
VDAAESDESADVIKQAWDTYRKHRAECQTCGFVVT